MDHALPAWQALRLPQPSGLLPSFTFMHEWSSLQLHALWPKTGTIGSNHFTCKNTTPSQLQWHTLQYLVASWWQSQPLLLPIEQVRTPLLRGKTLLTRSLTWIKEPIYDRLTIHNNAQNISSAPISAPCLSPWCSTHDNPSANSVSPPWTPPGPLRPLNNISVTPSWP